MTSFRTDRSDVQGPVPPRVLLADDHPALRMGIRLRLELDGDAVVVAEASDGIEALRLITQLTPDIALVDLRMPGLDGLQLVEQAVEQRATTRIVLLTALTDVHLVQRALDLGAAGYIGKESPMEVIIDALSSVAAGRRYIDPTLLATLLESTDDRLTEREQQVLQLAANGSQNKLIARQLGLGEETVKSHLGNIMRKLDAHSRTEAVASAMRRALIR